MKKADVTKIEVPAKVLVFQPPSHQNPHLKSHHVEEIITEDDIQLRK